MSQHIISILIFVVNKRDQFLINPEIHNTSTRHSSPLANLDIYQKGVNYSGIKNLIVFLLTLKHFLILKDI